MPAANPHAGATRKRVPGPGAGEGVLPSRRIANGNPAHGHAPHSQRAGPGAPWAAVGVRVVYPCPMYSDDEAAALYDVLNPWGPDSDFYLPLVMDAAAVLDVGCGTGTLLHLAREAGHTGRLCGVDPDRAMLARARRRTDIAWVETTAAAMTWEGEFDLAVMTGHAFQCLVSDGEIHRSLAAIRRALAPGGRFAFETRNPGARAWEGWTPAHATQAVDLAGRLVRISHEVESVADDIVTLTETTSDADGTPLRVDRASLRFLDAEALAGFLSDAGFTIEAQYGGWLREPLAPESPEIISIARAADLVPSI
jgi:SAM-dependent methyltransferase